MSIQIRLNEDYRLTSDSRQWIIQKKAKSKWENLSFHATPRQAVQHHAHRLIRLSDAETLTEALENTEKIVAELTQSLIPYFEVKLIERDDKIHNWTE